MVIFRPSCFFCRNSDMVTFFLLMIYLLACPAFYIFFNSRLHRPENKKGTFAASKDPFLLKITLKGFRYETYVSLAHPSRSSSLGDPGGNAQKTDLENKKGNTSGLMSANKRSPCLRGACDHIILRVIVSNRKAKRFQVSVFRVVCFIPLAFVDLASPCRRAGRRGHPFIFCRAGHRTCPEKVGTFPTPSCRNEALMKEESARVIMTN